MSEEKKDGAATTPEEKPEQKAEPAKPGKQPFVSRFAKKGGGFPGGAGPGGKGGYKGPMGNPGAKQLRPRGGSRGS